jgi:hypothetical protein
MLATDLDATHRCLAHIVHLAAKHIVQEFSQLGPLIDSDFLDALPVDIDEDSETSCSVCHARFPDEGDDVWRPGLRGCGRRSLREVRNEGETSTGDN